MPFEKGRKKTGGRPPKGSTPPVGRKSSRLVDRLQEHGFDFHKEFAKALKDLPDGSGPTGTRYTELKSLLPFMAPKLREKEVDTSEAADPMPTEAAISTKDLLEAFSDDKQPTQTDQGTSDTDSLGSGSAELSVPASTEVDLSDLAGEQGEDE